MHLAVFQYCHFGLIPIKSYKYVSSYISSHNIITWVYVHTLPSYDSSSALDHDTPTPGPIRLHLLPRAVQPHPAFASACPAHGDSAGDVAGIPRFPSWVPQQIHLYLAMVSLVWQIVLDFVVFLNSIGCLGDPRSSVSFLGSTHAREHLGCWQMLEMSVLYLTVFAFFRFTRFHQTHLSSVLIIVYLWLSTHGVSHTIQRVPQNK